MVRKIAIGIIGVLGLVSLGACAKPAVMTKAQYVQTANQVCKAAKDQAKALVTGWAKANPKERGVDGKERFVRFELIKHLRATVGTLRSIPPPDNDGVYLGSMYRDYEHALSVRYSDPVGSTYMAAETVAKDRFNTYGLSTCATMTSDADTNIAKSLG